MKNFMIHDRDTGKSYWISRAMAVAGVVYSISPLGELVFLVEKRGPGCPDFIGHYALPCGYLDWDETLKEAMIREVWEETGLRLDLSRDSVEPFFIQDDPKDNSRQNVTVRFAIEVPYSVLVQGLNSGSINSNTAARGGEEGEVESIELVRLSDLSKYEWAWNHDKVIKYLAAKKNKRVD